MTARRARALASLLAGALFAVGLTLGGMTQPARVKGFLDFAGAWDPTLMFVMGGALLVNGAAYLLWVRRRAAPLLGERFALPTRRDIDPRLVVGAAIFGLGWGLGGFCPGPGLTALGTFALAPLVFVAAMLVGMRALASIEHARAASAAARAPKSSAQPPPLVQQDAE